ncbi:MAG: protein-L-isoaspartate(D-aspartate) O-methyltransferase [Gammaproteobacteria bacterium]|nr:protein-L-isoaspartate(D-aspartate) O-methyltransferase [Gammaproteobacteria bacterium]MDH3506559.1 protein-L-isoaspartate(D-aspartate) O-methyltransferase [Gammaproteobacteria bacterium]
MSPSNLDGIGMTSARTRERLIERLRAQGITNEAVLERIRTVPRHLFIDEALSSHAYDDTALPIGFGQTISQPYIVALMTQALIDGLEPGKQIPKVLEIGTGCGYQTAVLAPFARHIFSLERMQPLVERAKTRLRGLKINNVTVRHADGWRGWQSQAPFQGIIVAAAPDTVPQALLDQLDDGGRLVIPIGGSGAQKLVCITRDGDEFQQRRLGLVSFVPLVAGMD